MAEASSTYWGSWHERVRALQNIPPLLGIVWNAGPVVVGSGLFCRVLAAVIPVSMLAVAKKILDAVQLHFSGHPLPPHFWWLVAAEFSLAYFDALLADRFTRHVSIRVMEHASRLDLASYEDPAFYDKLERARVQATDRIAMVQAIGTIAQQVIVAVTLSAGI